MFGSGWAWLSADAAGKVRKGRGVLEQLVIGPHGPSGFTGMMDMAKHKALAVTDPATLLDVGA